MEKLWRYTPQGGFTNKNAGFSMWCFGTYGGKEYFIKQFLSPKYPANDTESSAARIEKRLAECESFENRQRKLYAALTELSDGNDVRILDFFRIASRYYIVTEKVDALPWTVETIAALPEEEKRRLCAILAHAVASLHAGGLVHSDIKHDNVLFTYTQAGRVTAKLIDFDGSFLESDPPSLEEGVTGDANYFSPEACARSYGEESPLTCKLDVFALGVLFHQYFSGQMPDFDTDSASCPGEAVLQGLALQLDESLPEDVRQLLGRMLSGAPDERPTAQEVFLALRPAQAVEPVPEETVRFCTMCGRPVADGKRICDSCEALYRSGSAPAQEPKEAGGSAFYIPGDL